MKVILIALIVLSLTLISCDGSGQYDDFATCLFEKEVKMYGTEWCPHCKDQKELFGNSFKYVDYTDCDLNRDACLQASITGYPTWIINGQQYTGTQDLQRLASLTGCELT